MSDPVNGVWMEKFSAVSNNEAMDIAENIFSWMYFVSFFLMIAGCIMLANSNKGTYEQKARVDGSGEIVYAGFWVRLAVHFIDYFSMYLIIPLFFNLYLWFYEGQTLGCKAFRIRVYWVDREGIKTASLGQLFFYPFAKILNAFTLYIGFMMVGWTRKKQGLHNMLTDTVVIYTK